MKQEIWHMIQMYIQRYGRKPKSIVMGISQFERLKKEVETYFSRELKGELRTVYGVNIKVNRDVIGIFLTPFGEKA